MSTPPPAAIVLATNGEPRESAAIGFTAAEALRTGRPVTVVHVVHGSSRLGGTPSLVYSWTAVEEEAARVVEYVATRLGDLTHGAVGVDRVTPRGRTVAQLVSLSSTAHLLVLQRRGLPRRTHPGAGTTAAIAGRALSPVVSVPDTWSVTQSTVRRIVVGVGDPHESRNLLLQGFGLAAEHQVPLRVVHALGAESARLEAVAELDDSMARLRQQHPRLAVQTDVVAGPPEEVLLDAVRHDDLLVVGRRDASHPVYEHLGRVAKRLLRSSPAPLVVVPRPLADVPRTRQPVGSAGRPSGPH